MVVKAVCLMGLSNETGLHSLIVSSMKNETSITKSLSKIDEQYTITQCSNGYILELNGRDKKDDYMNIKHLVLQHGELVDVLIEVDQAI